MGKPLQMRAPSNYLRVDLRDPAEAEYWLTVLDATRSQLEAAVAAVGADAQEVDAHLRELRSRAAQGHFQGSHAENACARPGSGFSRPAAD